MKLFIDTSAFVARLDKKDACHDAAIEYSLRLREGSINITNYTRQIMCWMSQ